MIRKLLSSLLIAALIALSGSAVAHAPDLANPARMGPIRRNQTTMSQMRRWFGPPTVRKVVRVACSRVVKARWGRRLMVYASRPSVRRVAAVFVKKQKLKAACTAPCGCTPAQAFGWATGSANCVVSIPAREAILTPATPTFRLKTGRHGAYLMARVENRRVAQLEAWPYEFC